MRSVRRTIVAAGATGRLALQPSVPIKRQATDEAEAMLGQPCAGLCGQQVHIGPHCNARGGPVTVEAPDEHHLATAQRAVHEDGFQLRRNGQAVLDALGRIHQVLQRVRGMAAR
jgi:hypothetical protein